MAPFSLLAGGVPTGSSPILLLRAVKYFLISGEPPEAGDCLPLCECDCNSISSCILAGRAWNTSLSIPSDRLDPPQFAPELCLESCWGVWQAGLSWGDRECGSTWGVWQTGLSWGDRECGLTWGVWQAGLLRGVRKVCRVEVLPVLSQDVNLLATSDRLTSPLLLHTEEEEQSDLDSYTIYQALHTLSHAPSEWCCPSWVYCSGRGVSLAHSCPHSSHDSPGVKGGWEWARARERC